jgi:hypothetical protein
MPDAAYQRNRHRRRQFDVLAKVRVHQPGPPLLGEDSARSALPGSLTTKLDDTGRQYDLHFIPRYSFDV